MKWICLLFCVIFINGDQYISPIHEKERVLVSPEIQNIPLDKNSRHRPPKPIIDSKSIFVGLSVFRDSYRCAKTIFTGFKRAKNAHELYFGVVDQIDLKIDGSCKEEYCKLANLEWKYCKYKEQIIFHELKSTESRGPTFARSKQQSLVGDQAFCMQLDGHSIFTNDWDVHILNDWKSADNEMAVLSTYLHDLHDYIGKNGENHPPSQLPHLCKTIRGGNGLVRNEGASMLIHPKLPQLSALWGAGLSFSKCHAEKRVQVDPHTLWMFDGEEFLRSSHLWTHGYDMYSPSIEGAVVYHNYSSVPNRFERVKVNPAVKKEETTKGANRFRLQVGMPFSGDVDAMELDKYAFGTVRTFQQYLNFSGVTFQQGKKDKSTCHQLHWVPYTNPAPIQAFIPHYQTQTSSAIEDLQPVVHSLRKQKPRINTPPKRRIMPSTIPLKIILLCVLFVCFVFFAKSSQSPLWLSKQFHPRKRRQ